MFCKKCGNQMMENEKFCTSCGTAVQENENVNTSEIQVKSKNKSKKKIIIIGVVAAILIFCFCFLESGDVVSDLKDSTLPSYSEDITIGEAYENFFTDPSWSSCETDGLDVVVFNGYFYEESGEKIKATIEMSMGEDSIKWEEVVLYNIDSGDTTYLTDLELESLLNAIYENGTFSWYW
jgi:predicted nucleic acid-binding Zn ribbon protein